MTKFSHTKLCNDPSQRSLDILKLRCQEFFGQEEVWFPDHHESFPPLGNSAVTTVLFGNFLQRFMETGNWLYPTYKLWVLSHATKRVMTEMLGFHSDSISVIPREKIFSIKAASLPGKNEPFNLVQGGRISPQKNVAMSIRTVAHMRQVENVPVSLIFSGEWDSLQHLDAGLFPIADHKKWIEEQMEDLKPEDRPLFVQGTSEDWFKRSFAHPVYFNLSTFICEDFNVSLAQAQSAGWPALISDWGGHRDAQGYLAKVPSDAIAPSFNPTWMIDLKAKALAKNLAELWRSGNLFHSVAATENQPSAPKPISLSEIDNLRRNFVKRLGHDGLLLREPLPIFSATEEGTKLFQNYRCLFSGKNLLS